MEYLKHSLAINENSISLIYTNGDTILLRFVKDTWFAVIAEYEQDILITEGINEKDPFNN